MQVSGKGNKEEKEEEEHWQRFGLHILMCTFLLILVLKDGKWGILMVQKTHIDQAFEYVREGHCRVTRYKNDMKLLDSVQKRLHSW